MKAFIAISSQHKDSFSKELDAIQEALESGGYKVVMPVRDRTADKLERRAIMERAFSEIDSSDLLVAEVSNISFGVGIEIGYAKAHGKKVIVLGKKGGEISKTASGASDEVILYDSPDNLRSQLVVKI